MAETNDKPVDLAGNPLLSGVFAPVDRELDAAELPVRGTFRPTSGVSISATDRTPSSRLLGVIPIRWTAMGWCTASGLRTARRGTGTATCLPRAFRPKSGPAAPFGAA
jgi:hypothetical protein